MLLLANWMAEHLLEIELVESLGLSRFGISKHVLALFAVAGLLALTFIPFGRRVAANVAPTGRLVNLLEAVLLFLRDEVARPFLGKEGDRFLPVIWTFFFFILYCNLLGLIPIPIPLDLIHNGHVVEDAMFGTVTATGQVWVTGTLAAIAAIWYHGLGIKSQGLVAYIRHLVPSGVALPLVPLIFVLEVVGHIVKPCALMIRLWANMTGGHAVLYSFLGFVFMAWWLAPVTVVAGIAVFCLEIFVAFLQAYVFTFLVVVFLGGALHPH